MTIRKAWATTAAGGVGQIGVEESRLMVAALLAPTGTSGIASRSGFKPAAVAPGLVSATGTPDGNVHVNPFQAFLQTTRATAGGVYVLSVDASVTISVLGTPADPTNPRHDLIVAQQDDVGYGDADGNTNVLVVHGTPSGSPVDPTVTGSADYIVLARVNVRAATTTILGTDITDMRNNGQLAVAVGGILPVASATLRNALTGIYEGMQIYRTDTDWIEIYDGGAWRVKGTAIVSSIANLATITNPLSGQIASNTADGLVYRYTGSAWNALPGGIVATPVATATTGTATAGSTVEVRDSVVGNYTFTAVAGRRYRVMFVGRKLNGDTVGDQFEFRIRNGGASTPTASSTLIAFAEGKVPATGLAGRQTLPVMGTFIPGAGTVTLAAFTVRISGSGIGTPVEACEFFAEDIGGI